MNFGKRIIEKAESMGYQAQKKIKEHIPEFQQKKIYLAETIVKQNQQQLKYLDEILQELKFLNEKMKICKMVIN